MTFQDYIVWSPNYVQEFEKWAKEKEKILIAYYFTVHNMKEIHNPIYYDPLGIRQWMDMNSYLNPYSRIFWKLNGYRNISSPIAAK